MPVTSLLLNLLPLQAIDLTLRVVRAADEAPEDADVKAGWLGFAVVMLLIAATVLLLWSMTRHIRRLRGMRDSEIADAEARAEAAQEAQETPVDPTAEPATSPEARTDEQSAERA